MIKFILHQSTRREIRTRSKSLFFFPLYSRFTSKNKKTGQVEDWLFQQKA